MTHTFTLTPGIAAYMGVSENGGPEISVVFLSMEMGCVVGPRDLPMAEIPWPLQVKAAINRHFGTVFALEHETWHSRQGPSPRAQYVESLLPWTIEVEVDE